MEDLSKWENSANIEVIQTARAEILKSTGGRPLTFFDPFSGNGSIPLEAQRLGLAANAGDLNPVAVLITKAVVEIPALFAGLPPINPESRGRFGNREGWRGSAGLAQDVRYYGGQLLRLAELEAGDLYPKITLPEAYGCTTATVLAWLWARTVKCPNPACGAMMPLASKFWLSKKQGREAWVAPLVTVATKKIHFEVRTGRPDVAEVASISAGTCVTNDKGKKVKATFRCPVCHGGIAKGEYINAEANEGRVGAEPMAIVAKVGKNRIYLPFTAEHMQSIAELAHALLEVDEFRERIPMEPARGTFASNAQGRIYGFRRFADYFTPRQLAALLIIAEKIGEIHQTVLREAVLAGLSDDAIPFEDGGRGARAYADSIATYLACAVDRVAMTCNSLGRWNPTGEKVQHAFGKQALQMVWDFADANMFAKATGSLAAAIELVAEPLALLGVGPPGKVGQFDAASTEYSIQEPIVSTDPPYYDNVSYSDLSDFFYVWLRRMLGDFMPSLFGTVLTPKAQEIVVTPDRFEGDSERAEEHFLEGLGRSFLQMRRYANHEHPITVFYAFKQSEDDEDGETEDDSSSGIASTGWEVMLEGLLSAGFQITGTWPMRTEMKTRQVAMGSNALASSIVLVCRIRAKDAVVASRRDFLAALKQELPEALRNLQKGNIAPVDLAQAAIGPGMAVFSRYSKVLESDGSALPVRTALGLINRTLDDVLAEQEGEFEPDTRWALAWFDQHGFDEGPYGTAEVLCTAKATSMKGMEEAGILVSKGGKVRLLHKEELLEDWDPATDDRFTTWEGTHYLCRALEAGGVEKAAQLVARLGSARAETARDLAYRLYSVCERRKWAQDAITYNNLVIAWPEITQAGGKLAETGPTQQGLGL